ncbi:nucleotidyltransferase domain-containing protein [bacterium]|nr:nucleotidyltransferase domain-containing protein [bacterium]
MEKYKDRLDDYKYNFLLDLQTHLNQELIFFGSINRMDYFKNNSDIDIAIITDNTHSVLFKIQHYLNVDKIDIKKIYQQFNKKNTNIVRGYKIKYKDVDRNFRFDLVVYDEKYRPFVLDNIYKHNTMPILLSALLCILKFLFYKLYLFPKSFFMQIKNAIFYFQYNNTFFTI